MSPSNKSHGTSLVEERSQERAAPDLELVKPGADAADAQLTQIHAAIHALQRLTEVFQRRREQLASSVGITEREWRVLDGISSEDFMPSMFARRRESTPAAVSKILRQLIDKGLVNVTVSKADGRQRDYALTPKGKRTMLRLRKQRERAVQDVWLDLDAEKLKSFTGFGFDLASRLEEYAGLGDPPRAPDHTGELKD